MLQSGDGCDELTVVIGKEIAGGGYGSHHEAAQMHFNRR
jgi:hypothetical protein